VGVVTVFYPFAPTGAGELLLQTVGEIRFDQLEGLGFHKLLSYRSRLMAVLRRFRCFFAGRLRSSFAQPACSSPLRPPFRLRLTWGQDNPETKVVEGVIR